MAKAPYRSREFLSIKDGLKKIIKNNFSQPYATEEGLEIRKLQMEVEHLNKKEKVQKLSLGQKSNCTTKVIMLVGATGTGKTTLINAMVNYIYGVTFEDEFRFILVDNDASKKSEAESQTDFITAYTFYQVPGMPFAYNYVLIDTPGYGDTRGIQRDQEMAMQLESFLKQDFGMDEVDAIGFVTPVSVVRLTQSQRYVFDGLSSLFGKDVKENVYIMATFADAKIPPVQEALKKAGVHYTEIYKFNNSALFSQNRVNDSSDDESDYDNEDSIHISKLFWELGYRSMKNFFLKLSKTRAVKLGLTRNVLKEQSQLHRVVSDLQKEIHVGLGKLDALKQERVMLTQITDDMKGSSNFKEEVTVTRIRKIDLKPMENVTNCLECNFTCHYPCSRDDDMKWRCSSMNQGYCRRCPAKCFWNVHKTMSFRYESSLVKEQRIVPKLLERYRQSQIRKTFKEGEIRTLEREIERQSYVVLFMVKQAQSHIRCLDRIALRPNPLSTKAYIDLLIESEKMQKSFDFEGRILMLQTMKQKVAIIEGVKSHRQESGQSLLEYFQNLMIS